MTRLFSQVFRYLFINQPSHQVSDIKKIRSSNFELYRIFCMIMIVAHHYVCNSGLTDNNGFLVTDYSSGNSLFLSLFGAWGKTGINCFLMITGYYMCTSTITIRKFIKLMAEIYLYRWLVFFVLFFMGHETFSLLRFYYLCLPIVGLNHNFTSCFIVFWLFIPFFNILIRNLNKGQHELLLFMTYGCYTLFGSLYDFIVTYNYVTWFGIIYLLASYIRLYPNPLFNRLHLWGWMTFLSFFLATASIVFFRIVIGALGGVGYFFVYDCNKLFSVAIAVCSFLWFKNMNIKYNRFLNALGAGTFGVFLIHASSGAMQKWIWRDIFDVIGHSSWPLGDLIAFSVGAVLVVFIICNLIDQIRIATLEKWLLNWYDRKIISSRLT